MTLNFVVGRIVLLGGHAYLPQKTVILFTNDTVIAGVYSIRCNDFSIVLAFLAGIIMGRTKEVKAMFLSESSGAMTPSPSAD